MERCGFCASSGFFAVGLAAGPPLSLGAFFGFQAAEISRKLGNIDDIAARCWRVLFENGKALTGSARNR